MYQATLCMSQLLSVTLVKLLVTATDVPSLAEILVKLIEIVIREPAHQLLEQRIAFEMCGFF